MPKRWSGLAYQSNTSPSFGAVAIGYSYVLDTAFSITYTSPGIYTFVI